MTNYFAVGGHDYNSALAALNEVNPHPLPGMTIELRDFSGSAYDLLTGQPIASAQLELQKQSADGEWKFFDGFTSGKDGRFQGRIPDLGVDYRLVARAPGRPDPLPAFFKVAEVSHLDIGFLPAGLLLYDVRDAQALASTGAFARVKVNDLAEMGDLIADTDGSVDLWVHFEAIPEIDVTDFKVFINCDQVLDVNTTAPNATVKYDGHLTVPVPLAADAHLVVLGFGQQYLPRGLPQFNPARVPRVTTNAIYIDTNGSGTYDPPGGKACLYSIP